jgi:hypothetical protein
MCTSLTVTVLGLVEVETNCIPISANASRTAVRFSTRCIVLPRQDSLHEPSHRAPTTITGGPLTAEARLSEDSVDSCLWPSLNEGYVLNGRILWKTRRENKMVSCCQRTLVHTTECVPQITQFCHRGAASITEWPLRFPRAQAFHVRRMSTPPACQWHECRDSLLQESKLFARGLGE